MSDNADLDKIKGISEELKDLSHLMTKMPLDIYSKKGLKDIIRARAENLDDIVRRIELYLGMPSGMP